MTFAALLDETLRREMDARYPHGWRVGLDKDGEWAILYRLPPEAKPREAARRGIGE